MKQTSIEWLIEELEGSFSIIARAVGVKKYNEIVKNAIEMHKQEIIDAAERWKETDFAERYYEETFVSKGGDTLKDYHIVDTNEMVEVHPLEILRNKIKCEISELEPLSKYSAGYKQAFIDVENMIMDMLAQLPQQEISDEEIEKEAYKISNDIDRHIYFVEGAKLYREQLKLKQPKKD